MANDIDQHLSEDLDPVLPAEQWRGKNKVRQLVGESVYGPVTQFSQDVARHGRPVAYIRRADGAGGTGFLIAPDLLLTNHHVLGTPEQAAQCTVWFNFINGMPGQPVPPEADAYKCHVSGAEGFFYASPYQELTDANHLDFALVRVANRPGDTWGYVPIARSPYAPLNMALTIIQHPRQRPMHVGQGDGQLKHRSDFVLHYVTDTEAGSSGSPVFNSFWELVGLHHAWFNFPQGTQLEDGKTASADQKGNEGITITAILADIAKNASQVALPAEQRDGEGRLLWP